MHEALEKPDLATRREHEHAPPPHPPRGDDGLRPRAKRGEPGNCLVEHLVPLAEREADQ